MADGPARRDGELLEQIARVVADNERRVEEIANQAHVRYHADAEFHARAYMAAQIAEHEIEASGHRVDRTTRLHVLRAAILGVFVADLDPATGEPRG